VSQEQVAHKRPVRLGLEEGNYVEAVEGIEPGERVIVAGQGGLKDGSPIKVLGEEIEEPEGETLAAAGTGR